MAHFSWRVLGRVVASIALTSVFVVTFATSFVLHGDTPTTRRFVASTASSVLAKVFPGKLEVDDIRHLGFDGVDIGYVRAIDPRGRPVIALRGVHVRASLPTLARRLLGLDGTRVLFVEAIGVDDAQVILHKSGAGVSIAETFVDFSPSAASGPSSDAGGSTPFLVELPLIVIQRVHVMGGDGIGESLDVDLARVPGRVSVLIGRRVTVDVRRSAVRFRGLPPVTPHGTAEYHLLVDDKSECNAWMNQGRPAGNARAAITGVGSTACMWGAFDGDLGDVNVTASGTMVDGVLDATAIIPRARPAEIAAMFPAVRLQDDARVDAHLLGRLPIVAFDARALLGQGDLSYSGNLELGWPMGLEGDFVAHDLDARTLIPGVPPTSIEGNGHATVRLSDAGHDVNVALWTRSFTIAGTVVPATKTYTHLDRTGIETSFEVDEIGAALSGKLTVSPSSSVNVSADFAVASLASMPRLLRQVTGAASGKVEARLDAGRLEAVIRATGTGVGRGENIVGGATLRARVFGPLDALRVDGTVDGRGIRALGLTAEGGRVAASGSLAGPYDTHLELTDPRWSRLRADASVGLFPGPSVRNLAVTLDSSTVSGTASVGSLAVGEGVVDLRAVKIDAGGVSAAGTVRLGDGGSRVDLSGTVDLAVFSKQALDGEIKRGQATFAVHTDEGLPHRRAGARFQIRGLELRHAPLHISADGEAVVEGDHVEGKLTASALAEDGTSLALLSGSGDGSISGPLIAAETWTSASGHLGIDDLRVDIDKTMAKSAPLLAALDKLGVEVPKLPALSGALHGSARLSRTARTGPPDVTLEVRTEGFSATGGPGDSPLSTWRGMDGRVVLFAAKNPDVGAGAQQSTRFGGEAHLVDPKGALVDFTVASELPADRARDVVLSYLLDAGLPRDQLAALPLDISFSLSDRPVAALPPAFRPEHVMGSVAAEARVKGTLGNPSASFVVRGTELYAESERAPWPITTIVGGRISGKNYDFTGGVVHGDAEVAQLGVSGRLDLEELALGRLDAVPESELWTGSAVLVLKGLQLDSIPGVAERGMSGRLSGAVSIRDLHKKAEINVHLDVLRGSAFGGDFASAALEAHLVDGPSNVHLRLEQQGSPGERGGVLEASVRTSLLFRDGLIPVLDPGSVQSLDLSLAHLDVAPFAALAQPILGDVGGNLDGGMSATTSLADGATLVSGLRGEVRWSEGSLLIPQIGQTFTGGRFVLAASRGENGEVQVGFRDISLEATSGRVQGLASVLIPEATISAWLRDDTQLGPEAETLRVLASVRISDREKIPITLEGVALGDAFGAADMLLRVRARQVDVDLAVPELTFELPDSLSRKVQDLADAPDIVLLDKKYALASTGPRVRPTPIVIRIGIGDPLADLLAQTVQRRGYVTVRRSGLGVTLRGRPTVRIVRNVRVEGTIETLGGRVNALGKPFEVEPGIIRFDGDPTNPALSVRARWDAPTGVRVYAEASGNLVDAKLKLRSDPPRPEGDVLSLVLFGRDQQTASTGVGSDSSGSFAVGGGVATSLINTLLEPVQVFGRRIETRVDTSSATNTKFGVATEIRPNLWAQIDLSTARQQLRLQNQDTSSLTLDWRFRPAWSLRTSVGDRGSSIVDLLWSYRY